MQYYILTKPQHNVKLNMPMVYVKKVNHRRAVEELKNGNKIVSQFMAKELLLNRANRFGVYYKAKK
jgi:hypothetical protein